MSHPALAWILVMVVFVILFAVTWMAGQLVGELFPALEAMGNDFVPVSLVTDAILIWMPLGLGFGFVLWAIAYTFLREAVVR
ncbi:hypothetical protein [Natrarchaeobius chitinivorans]|uniref:Uncharacterized protein n=1 Tax=Natrarchaeobius chitinivorans TaxID=1679083 RepID=A0A3N6LQP2_NATCH|nr:hypothetical protein [Natrarchaeobius chitinivorans]RQG89324.1 hypothetical protein EA473_22205 [Natrarchaeobius chitinivorans]